MVGKRLFVCALALLLPAAATAEQHEETASPPYAYGTYYECDSNREWLADDMVERYYKPIYDAAVDDGTITGWGYLAHHTGGKWRRVVYHVAPTIDQALAALSALGDKMQSTSASAAAEFGSVCSRHDDYLWRSIVGSAGTDNIALERGAFGFSTYLHCNEATESKADEIVKTVFAPIFDAEVASGSLVSWGYMEHWVGGEYRRLLTMTAKDLATLMKGRDRSVNALLAKTQEAAAFFASCTSHSDYIWEIKHEKP